MKTRSNFSCLRSPNSRSFGSKAWASTPRWRNASSTACPDSSDISLSDERPPINTATFPILMFMLSLPCFTNYPHFSLQRYPGFVFYGVLNKRNQLLHVPRNRPAFIDDEICV